MLPLYFYAQQGISTVKKKIFFFGNGSADGKATMKAILGGKGANLAEMSRIGIPVPAGFTISTEVCTYFFKHNGHYPDELRAGVDKALSKVGKAMGSRFGDPRKPLLLSVRSGARVSMPGMMDTVLNLGLNEETLQGLLTQSGDARFVYDCYRRFIHMYANVVLDVPHERFEETLTHEKKRLGKQQDVEMSADDWRVLAEQYKAIVLEVTGKPFPEDPLEQLWGAIGAVFNSWHADRAITYRRLNNIPEDWGTAVNVQAMVFGNMGMDSATGVAFTRDPATGDNRFFGEFLINAQGEDVVAGIRTPQEITIDGKNRARSPHSAMEEVMPALYQELVTLYKRLEGHFRDMQDLEFTVQQGKMWLLQTRNGKRTVQAALRIALDMVKEGLITPREAIMRVKPEDLNQLLHPTLDPKAKRTILATGVAASPGGAVGEVVFTPEDAVQWVSEGHKVILVREETSPEDIHGMHAAQGIVTARGGATSHAAVVARGMGRPCVSGCHDLEIDMKAETCTVKGVVLRKGDWITIDGDAGQVLQGRIPMIEPQLTGDFDQFMKMADVVRHMKVRANADTPTDAENAVRFGAEGIGLCRTEHMFFKDNRILAVREMILAQDEAGRRTALDKIMPMQRSDFEEIFRVMKGRPVTIRLLDPPLHEFLPHEVKEQTDVAEAMGVELKEIQSRVSALKEFNPMLGHRGCRLGITYPEIYEMQVRAIMEAACGLVKNEGFTIIPEIMIPLVGLPQELKFLKVRCLEVCRNVMESTGVKIDLLIGTMIELPRAALVADLLAEDAEFFSFGTNDLTQTTLGISRDDATPFISAYLEKGLVAKDPFVSLDQTGVGQLVEMGVKRGREARKSIKIGVCGEHGGDPASIGFFEKVGLDYVSCSPFRVPVARLAAAQAVIAE
ncbi:MAG: pyruvate, phosphate dikinase [Magnetococcales bacterium]|nr:pyruvate, phosphate dikinase [Magnetococcales bacterium]